MTHEEIWKVIDSLAASRGLSPFKLAQLSGMDNTTFNPSKRFNRQNKECWPSTKTISKIITGANSNLREIFKIYLTIRKST
jgi:hypothetical protein